MKLQITSPAFAAGESIPKKYTCDGENISPPLEWSGVPAGAKSLVLIVDDPDAPGKTWVHWVLFNINPARTRLPGNASRSVTAERLGVHGLNDFRAPGYGGPCPPPGKPHRYFFRLHALYITLDLPAGATRAQVDRAMEGHILAQGHLMGLYGR